MCEIKVQQRSSEWHALRNSVTLTASKFCDAVGLGRGKPYDYLLYLASPDGEDTAAEENGWIRHGIRLEPVINEAYQLLTGLQTQPGGFWLPAADDPLYGKVGASPDALVFEGDQDRSSARPVGLAEFKAPFYRMYDADEATQPHGIPRRYMAQVQGQMAVCRMPWCDLMAICTATKEVLLKRIYFQPTYWDHLSGMIKDFCHLLKVVRMDQHESSESRDLKLIMNRMSEEFLPGETDIRVEDLLSVGPVENNERSTTSYKSLSGTWMSYEFLVGLPGTRSSETSKILRKNIQ